LNIFFHVQNKKGKGHPVTGHKGREGEYRYISTLCLTSALKEVGEYAVAHLVEALRYKPEGRGFDSQWSHWSFSVT
jgi:hypothetical protein